MAGPSRPAPAPPCALDLQPLEQLALDPEHLRQLAAQIQTRLDWVAKQRRSLGVIGEILAASRSTSTAPDAERKTP